MRVEHAEAIDLLRKWLSERMLLECSMNFPTFRARFRARMARFDGRVFGLVSDDLCNELAMTLAPWMVFGYGESADIETATEFRGLLVIFYRVGIEGEQDSFLAIAEVPN